MSALPDGTTIIHPTLGAPEMATPFHDAQGALLGHEVRFKGVKGLPLSPSGEWAAWWGKTRPLFGLPTILSEPSKTIIVCEGPKTMHAAQRLFPGSIVTCWPGGVNARHQVDFGPLKGRTVVWWPDVDGAGFECMDDCYLNRAPAHKGFFVLPPDGVPSGWDAADLEAGQGIGKPSDPRGWLRSRIVPHGKWCEVAEPIIQAWKKATEAKRNKAEEKRRDKAPRASASMPAGGRPEIQVIGGQLPRVVDEAEEAFLRSPHSANIYQHVGKLIEFSRLPKASVIHGVKREAGSPILLPVTAPRMQELFTRAVDFTRWDSRMNGLKSVDCPPDVAAWYLARSSWGVRPLSGLAEGPTLRPDGSILQAEGYDPATGLLVSFGGESFLEIPEAATREEADDALDRLRSLTWDFPFVEEVHRSAAAAAILTGAIRRSLPSAPMFPISATAPGTGKSLLTDVISIILTGRSAPAMAQGPNAEENEKRLVASLLSGDSILNIDNVSKPLEGDALCVVLTQEAHTGRILGKSKNVHLPTNFLILANGNNITVRGDLASRCLMIRMDAEMERPETRTFPSNSDGDLRERTREKRADLLRDALTVLRAHHVSGRPGMGIAPWGRFEAWSEWVRAAIVWLGHADPVETSEEMHVQDPSRETMANLLDIWNDRFGPLPKTLREIIDSSSGDPQLDAVLLDAAGERNGRVNARTLGWLLKRNENRVLNNLKVARDGKKGYLGIRWVVQSTQSGRSSSDG